MRTRGQAFLTLYVLAASCPVACNRPQTVQGNQDVVTAVPKRPGTGEPPGDDPTARALAALEMKAARKRGEATYRHACATCHGLKGDGKGPSSAALEPLPRDFTRGLYKWRSTESGSLPLDGDLFLTISRGVPGTTMPAWQQLLSAAELWDVVEHVKSFSRRFEEEAVQPEEVVEIPGPAFVTEETLARGKKVYEDSKCWECHGRDGTGDGPSAPTLRDSWGNPVRPFDFTTGRYRCGGTDRDIYRTFSTGLNGTPMPTYALTIPAEDRWPLVHYVRSLERKPGFLSSMFFANP